MLYGIGLVAEGEAFKTDLLSSSCSGLYNVFRDVKNTVVHSPRRMVLCTYCRVLLDFVILYGNNEHFQVNI